MSNMDLLQVTARLESDKRLPALFDIIRDYGETPCAVWLKGEEELSLSYGEMARRADDYAAYLKENTPEGGWIGVAVDTCPNWPTLFWGVIRSGHNVLLLDASAADSMIQGLMEEAGCKVIISRKPRGLSGDIRQIDYRAVADAPRTIGFTPAWGEYVAMCTSGTTGNSRIFAYSGQAICEQALTSMHIFRTNPRVIRQDNVGRLVLAFLPFHHVLGFMANMVWVSFLGATNIYLPDRTPNSIMNVCRHFPPTLLIVVPLVGNNLVKSLNRSVKKEKAFKRWLFKASFGLSLATQSVAPSFGLRLAQKRLFAGIDSRLLGTQVDAVILGGSHTPTETLRTLNALGYYTINGYGMTETAVNGFETSMSLRKRLNGSVGATLGSAEYRIAGETGAKTGELQVRGPGIHSGRVVKGEILPPDTLDGGWFPTGDVAAMDSTGRVTIKGRLKDVIINESGENVYPDDLEDAFSALAGAEQICVVGFPRNKRDNNEDVTLVLNVGENYSDKNYLNTLAGKVAAINSRLPLYAQLDRALVTPMTLPLVSGIKVKRIELKRLYEEKELVYRELDLRAQSAGAEVAAASEKARTKSAMQDEIRRKVRTMYAEALDIPEKEISDNANFIEDLQGDSLQVLSIALKAEEEWGITIPAEEYGQCATVESMSRVVEDLLTGGSENSKPRERVPVRPVTRFEDSPEYLHFLERQKALVGNGDNPYFVAHESPLLDTGIVDGKEILEFGSYNYIGMSGRKEVKEAAKAAIEKYGTSASGSRLLAGEKMVHKELEKEIADWKHTEDAIVCVGGHSTNVTFVGNFCGKNDLILYDALAHNSIEQGCKLSDATSRPFPHSDVAALESILKSQRAYFEKVLIVIEGAYSMDGDIAPVPDFVRVKKEYGCFLMVDEAHSACVIGEHGGGVDEYFNLDGYDIDIKYGTLSKGLGTCGGYLAGRKCLIDYLRYNMPGFVFSVGISPALAAGSLEAIRTLRSHPEIMEHLRTAIRSFAESAKRRHLDICLAGETAVLPVLVGKDEDAWLLSNELKKRGVSVPPAMYPAVPKGKARLRFCVISEHKPEQIERALDILESTAKEFGIELPRRNYE